MGRARHLLVVPTAAAVFLSAVSFAAFGNAFRPGLVGELVLIVYVTAIVLEVQRQKWRGVLVSGIIIGTIYALCVAKWLWLGESAHLSDLQSAHELWSVTPRLYRCLIAVCAAVLILGFIGNLRVPQATRSAALLLPLIAFTGASWVWPRAVTSLINVVRPPARWDSPTQLWLDGPLFTFMRELPRTGVLEATIAGTGPATDSDFTISVPTLARLPAPSRNLHMVHMESFVDPLTFRGLRWPQDPLDPRLRRWLTEGASMTLSATFGGESARAEFEVLCGVPAYGLLGIEFQALRGASIDCLPAALRAVGYVTVANVASEAAFFNVGTAYQAVGFGKRHFDSDFIFDDMDGSWLSDDAVFTQSRTHVEADVAPGKPVLNYVVTWVGHRPVHLNPLRRPSRFATANAVGTLVDAAYYDSRALADYVDFVEAHDPRAVIIAYGDHLPALTPSEYSAADYRAEYRGRLVSPFWAGAAPQWLMSRATMLLVRRDRQTIAVGIVPQFLIPELALDLITDGAYCAARQCVYRGEIIYRPNGAVPVFSTVGEFPQPKCETTEAADASCDAARELAARLQRAYASLLRRGASPISDGSSD